MTFYDWAVVAIGAVFVIRGWRRGMAREAIEAALLLLGTFLAFRLSPAVGTIISGMATLPYEVGRVVAGVVIFVALVVGAILLGRIVATALRIVPGASMLDRIGGAAVGLVFAAIVVVLGTTLLAAAPLPERSRGAIDDALVASPVASAIVDPNGSIQPSVSVASGASVVTSIVAVRDAVGERLMAGTIPIPFPTPNRSDLAPSQAKAHAVFDEINVVRIGAGADPLAWSPDLAIVAVARATDVYGSGLLTLDGDLDAALRAAGVPGTISDDLVVIAASPDGLVEAIVGVDAYRSLVEDPSYRKAGIGVIDGPYGLIAVQVVSA